VLSQLTKRSEPVHVARTTVAIAMAWRLVLMALLATAAQTVEPLGPSGRMQLAGELRRDEQPFGEDLDRDEWEPPSSHRKLMPGQKPGTTVTAPPHGYDARRLNRLWGRFRGARGNAKTEKSPK
jgi:hypothetical protein